ncbi:hypothetical protein GPAL_2226 [Glaciecola pallidula DSM 14239 = ACAM 615]|jgi:hypothetical protein|uniref:Uncharacterized protein n=1 Tax=Brumicola pallidula DSM 14239 = ACAM 615 TaxID=1121922 RepID=K6ZFF6_9ALTE|nr:hypothetical protein GPAL_2226 [Glaciecola pallidula DSM 14239 = ACAM 615]
MSINKPSVRILALYYNVFSRLYTAEMVIKEFALELLADLP